MIGILTWWGCWQEMGCTTKPMRGTYIYSGSSWHTKPMLDLKPLQSKPIISSRPSLVSSKLDDDQDQLDLDIRWCCRLGFPLECSQNTKVSDMSNHHPALSIAESIDSLCGVALSISTFVIMWGESGIYFILIINSSMSFHFLVHCLWILTNRVPFDL